MVHVIFWEKLGAVNVSLIQVRTQKLVASLLLVFFSTWKTSFHCQLICFWYLLVQCFNFSVLSFSSLCFKFLCWAFRMLSNSGMKKFPLFSRSFRWIIFFFNVYMYQWSTIFFFWNEKGIYWTIVINIDSMQI